MKAIIELHELGQYTCFEGDVMSITGFIPNWSRPEDQNSARKLSLEVVTTGENIDRKIYVVTKGSYSDYHIVGVSLSKETAEKIASVYSGQYEPAHVEEYEEDRYQAETIWEVKISRDGKLESIVRNNDEGRDGFYDGVFYCSVHSNDVEKIAKIAFDRRAEALAKANGVA